jgi:hypothetical protein
MGSVAVLPRVLVHRTPFGTRVEWHRGPGLLAFGAAARCRSLASEELRYPFLAALAGVGAAVGSAARWRDEAAALGSTRLFGGEPWLS